MKNRLILSLIFLCTIPGSLLAQQTSDSLLNSYINKWEKAVIAHDIVDILNVCDSSYKAEQLYQFLEGRTEQFINELFCGNIVGKNKFKCIELKDIRAIERAEIDENEYGFRVCFIIKTKKEKIQISLLFVESIKAGKKQFGFRGGVG